MKRLFNLSWIIFYLIVIITPASSTNSEYDYLVILVNLVFIIIFNISLYNVFPKRNFNSPKILSFKKESIFVILGYLGILCFLIDRFLYQGIGFSSNVAEIRYQITEREGVSSIFSAVGYILNPANYLLLLIGIFNYNITKEHRGWKYLLKYILPAVVSTMVISFLTGGRTSILFIIALFLVFLVIRNYFSVGIKVRIRSVVLLGAALVMFSSYIFYVFAERAKVNNIPMKQYSESLITRLEGTPNLNPPSFVNEELYYLTTSSLTYIAHVQWVSAAILQTDLRPGNIFFNQWKSLLSRAGLKFESEKDWLFIGAFVSIPIAVLYDYGLLLGFFCICLYSFLFRKIAKRLMKGIQKTYILLLFILFSVTIVLSPFCIGTDLLIFPLSCICFSIISITHPRFKLTDLK